MGGNKVWIGGERGGEEEEEEKGYGKEDVVG